MTQFNALIKPGFGPVLKVMTDDAADPLGAADIFDSERAHKIGYVFDIMEINYDLTKWPRPGTDNTMATYYEPPGSNSSTALEQIMTRRANGSESDGEQFHVIFPEKLGFSYTPIIEGKRLTVADSRFSGASSNYATSAISGSSETGHVTGRLSWGTWFRNTTTTGGFPLINLSRLTYSLYGYAGANDDTLIPRVPAQSGVYRDLFSVLELPAGNEPLPTYATTPVDGQCNLAIEPNIVRMSYPGHDIAESSHEAFIFSESRIPAKLIGAGQTSVNSGANVKLLTKRPTTLGTYMDFIVKRTSEAQFHHPPFLPAGTAKSNKIQLDYVVEADGVRVYNTGDQNFDLRYMIFADDNSAPTTGGSKVLFSDNDGTVDYIMLKQPGSSDTAPGLNDIILDTRLPYIPIVDEGWLSAADFTETSTVPILGSARKTINFTNSGFIPFPKYIATWSDGSMRSPVNRILRSFNLDTTPKWDNAVAGNTTNCRIFDDKLEFYHASGQPWRTTISSNAFGTYASPVYGPSLVGIRWYLFAIPLSL
jgi:hypothetical protein